MKENFKLRITVYGNKNPELLKEEIVKEKNYYEPSMYPLFKALLMRNNNKKETFTFYTTIDDMEKEYGNICSGKNNLIHDVYYSIICLGVAKFLKEVTPQQLEGKRKEVMHHIELYKKHNGDVLEVLKEMNILDF